MTTSTNGAMPGRQRGGDALTHALTNRKCDASVRQYVDAALSDNTLRAYRSDLKHFLAWGGTIPASPERVATYIAHHATTLAGTSLSRRLVAIARAHAAQGLPSPTASPLVRATLRGIRRTSHRPVRQVAPLQKADLVRMVHGLHGLRGLRDTALLLVGFASAMRRSELVSLNVEDIQFTDEGTLLRLRRSKTDQEGSGRDIAIPRLRGRHCPSRCLLAWLEAAGITAGALFRRVNRYDQVLPHRLTAQSVALIIKERAAAAGLDPTRFSGHSLRAGFVTNATNRGASSSSIRRQTGHTSDAMLQRYVRNSQLFTDNPNRKIW
jgi:site-specific recombinase XerD